MMILVKNQRSFCSSELPFLLKVDNSLEKIEDSGGSTHNVVFKSLGANLKRLMRNIVKLFIFIKLLIS